MSLSQAPVVVDEARAAELRERLALIRMAKADQVREQLKANWTEAARRGPHASHPGRSLLSFVRLTHPGYAAGWFHRQVCSELEQFFEDVKARRSPHLMLFAPPQHGKSAITSQRAPPWAMGHQPGLQIIATSYSDDLAEANSRIARSMARSDEAEQVFAGFRPVRKKKRFASDYQPNNVDQIARWVTGNGSTYKAVGVGGPITGSPANVGILDDPVKGAAEVRSSTKRAQLREWYGSDFYSRINPGGGVLLMMTRWHEDDLAGNLLASEGTVEAGGRWKVLRFPAIAEEDEPFRREGEALHPERWSLESLQGKRATMGETVFAALYQQRPRPASGGMFQRSWFNERYTCRPEDIAREADEVWLSSDAAQKGGEGNDFHALHVWARKGSRRFLLDRVTDRMGLPEYERAMDDLYAKWEPFIRAKGGVLVEDTANGSAYIQTHRGRVHNLIGFSPRRDTPGDDSSKVARASYLSRAAEAGQVILPDFYVATWASDWIDTIVAFPAGAHDDDVDASSQINMRWTLGLEGQPADSWLARALGY